MINMIVKKSDVKGAIALIGDFIIKEFNTLNNYSDGRVEAAVFDDNVAEFLRQNEHKASMLLTNKFVNIFDSVKLTVPAIREFYDFSLVFYLNNQMEQVVVNAKLGPKSHKKQQNNNVNGGAKLVAYLLNIDVNNKSPKQIKEDIKSLINITNVKDYFILEIQRDLKSYKISSIFDGGLVVNASQTWPGLQYDISKSKWKQYHLSALEKLEAIEDWNKQYLDKRYKQTKGFKEIATTLEKVIGLFKK